MVAFVASGCVDVGLNARPGDDDPSTSDTDGGYKGDVDTWPPRNGEYCNGLDDDGDGQIDEGFPDTDKDGIADCVDEGCDVVESDATDVGSDPDCAPNGGEPPVEPWRIVQGWSWRGEAFAPDMTNVFTPPMVGRITDDDGDGDVDADDGTDVAFIAFNADASDARLFVLDGRTGIPHWSVDGIMAFGSLAIADVNNDGRSDIVTYSDKGHPVAYDGEGNRLWIARLGVDQIIPAITVADLDADGTPDVIADNLRIRGTDGEVLNAYNLTAGIAYRMPAVGDINLDGKAEVILGNTAFSPTGQRLWTLRSLSGEYGHWSAILEADSDPFAEVAMVSDGRLVIMNHDGTVITDVASGNDHPGAPCVGDFDGDGEAEIGWASNNLFVVHDLDGTPVWTSVVQDGTGLLATCSGFDFDGDGSLEILYNDNFAVHLFNGRTGADLYLNEGHASTTIWEYPTIADIDDDGSAEILVASNQLYSGGWAGVTVLEHWDDQWMPAAETWQVHDYAVTNVLEDGTVPRSAVPSWQQYNVYRARPASNELVVDLQPTILDVCWTGCHDEGIVSVAVQIYNAGNDNSVSQIPVAMYAVEGERRELIAVKRVPRHIAGGWVSDTIVFDVNVGQLGADGFVIVADDDGTGDEVHPDECDETNNEIAYNDGPCREE